MSNAENGHDNNIANFEDLISFCSSYGGTYNPGANSLQIASMSNLLNNAGQMSTQTKSMENALRLAQEQRTLVFKQLNDITSRCITTLKSFGASAQTLKAAIALNNKMHGRDGKTTKADAGKKAEKQNNEESGTQKQDVSETKTRSTARTGFDSRVEHAQRFLELLSSTQQYTPNEAELSAQGYATLIANMKAANSNVINANTNLSNTRIARNEILYKPETGLYFIAKGVQNYVKALFGAKSAQYKQVSGLKFVNLDRKK
jgi:hypothetical protein